MGKESNEILQSWRINASAWIKVIENEGIESRRLVTNKAIELAIAGHNPKSILDIGCGEGWLTERLFKSGISAHGVDAIPALIEKAKSKNGPTFEVRSYQELIDHAPVHGQPFESAVINFALFENEETEKLIKEVPYYLHPKGLLFIQTLHPLMAIGDRKYQSGWLEGSWAGIEGDFTKPHPWYFRTLQAWIEMIRRCNYDLIELVEPVSPKNSLPASIIFVLQR